VFCRHIYFIDFEEKTKPKPVIAPVAAKTVIAEDSPSYTSKAAPVIKEKPAKNVSKPGKIE
jgi:hypothetical protein